MLRATVLFLAAILAACQVRQAEPVRLADPGDEAMGCEEIAAEIAANEREALALAGEADSLDQRNTAMRAAGTVFVPLMISMDLSDAERIELRALADRNARLERLWARRNCDRDDANL